MGCHFLRQGIFLTQESNLPGRWILYHWATREVQNVLYVVPSFPQTMESSEGCELLQGSHPILGICASQSPAPDLAQGSYLIKVCGLEWMIQKCEQRLECGSLQDVCLLNCCFLMFWISYLPKFFFFFFNSHGILDGSDNKESACNLGNMGSIPGSGRSPGERKGYPLQYSCLENSIDRGDWWTNSMGLQRAGHNWVTNTHVNLCFYLLF